MKKLEYLLFSLLFSLLVLTFFYSFGDNSEGIRQCVPTKLSYRGWVWKT